MIGGAILSPNGIFQTSEILGEDNLWKTVSPAPLEAVKLQCVVWMKENTVLVAGGQPGTNNGDYKYHLKFIFKDMR